MRHRGFVERLHNRVNAQSAHARGKAVHDLLRRGLHIFNCLRERHARFHAAHHRVIPASGAIHQLALGKAHRNPQLAAIQLPRNQRKFEIARHHANNLVGFAVEHYLGSKYTRIRMEPAVPHLVADHGHLLPALIFLLCEDAAHLGRDAKHLKH